MKILVTGAAGFVGRALCRLLLDRQHAVVAMWHRQEQGLDGLAGTPGLQIVQGDIRDRADMVNLCRSIDAICHLAVLPPGADNAEKTNVEGTRSVVDACIETGVKRLVYASSMSVYDFTNPHYLPVDEAHPCVPGQDYGREKLQGESLCISAGQTDSLQVCALRLAGIYGPGKNRGAAYVFAKAIMDEEIVRIEADRSIDLLYLDDAVQAMKVALDGSAEGIFNIGTGVKCSLTGLAEMLAHRLGRRLRVECDGPGNAFWLDITRAQSILGYRPLSLDGAIDRYIPWVLQHAAN